jgi:cytochrome P450
LILISLKNKRNLFPLSLSLFDSVSQTLTQKNKRMINSLVVLTRLLAAVCIGGLLYLTVMFIYHKYQLRRFPGPPSFPVIGSCWDPGFVMLYKHLQNLRLRYGKMFYIFSFHRPVVVIADPLVARRLLSDHKTFFKGDDYTTTFAYTFGKGLVTSNGEDHRKGRSLLGKYFIRSSVSKFTDQINEIAAKTIAEMIDAKQAPQGKDFNMEEFFAVLALRCFAKFSCDVDTSHDPVFETKLCHLVSKFSYAMSKMIILQEPFWPMMPHAKVVMKTNAILTTFFNSCVQERKQRLSQGESFDDMLQAMLSDDSITDQDRTDHFRTAICAGHDTAAFFMSYCVYLLARHPEIQSELYEHIQEVIGDKEVITADDTAKLKFLQCVMMETLRLYPVIPNVTRVCSEDVHIKDEGINVTLPKGITLMISMIVMNKDPEVWENPNEFRPSRFENKASADFTSAKDGYFPFAYGTRICIGNTLAQIESGIILTHLMRKFTFSEVKGGFRPLIRGGISLTTSNGMQIHLAPRHPQM